MPLTDRQKWRIENIQAQRVKKANQTAKDIQNLKTKTQIGLVITRYAQQLLVENRAGELVQCYSRQNIGSLVAGDQVVFQITDDGKGVVTALLERNNYLKRLNKLIAANVDMLCLVVAIKPHYEFSLIDRYLIIAKKYNLPIRIVVNKIELSDNIAQVKSDFSMYEAIDYPVSYLSINTKSGIDAFKSQLRGNTQLLLGQSGVGKSSLINTIIPELDLRINEISAKSGLGKHTTTNTVLYHIPSGGNLVDSPGVREFHLDDLTNQEISAGFKEFQTFASQCKFRDCIHIDEPDCGVKNAVKVSDIHLKRYESYLSLINT